MMGTIWRNLSYNTTLILKLDKALASTETSMDELSLGASPDDAQTGNPGLLTWTRRGRYVTVTAVESQERLRPQLR